MGTIKNMSGEARTVPGIDGGRRVEKDQEVEVPDDEVFNYTQSSLWAPVGKATTAVHEAGAAGQTAAQMLADGPLEEPDVDAPREVWGGYALAAELATADDLVGLDRDAIREAYLTPEPEPEPEPEDVVEEPSGNASRDEWAAYALTLPDVTEDDLDGKGRDEIRDTYKTEG